MKKRKQTFIKDKETYIPNVDLEGLTAEQRIMVQEMLQEECESFSKDGEKHQSYRHNPCAKDIHRCASSSLPRSETVCTVEDLLNQGWVQRSSPPTRRQSFMFRRKMGHSGYV